MKIGRFEAAERAFRFGPHTLRLLVPRAAGGLLDDPDVHRRFEEDEYMPYWAECWPAGERLARHLLDEAPFAPGAAILAPGAAVLELGAGLGVVGLALAQAGRRVTITDYDADALAFVAASAALNGVTPAGIELLDWRHPPPRRFDHVVAADVLYERRSHEPILALLAACLADGATAYLSDPHRSIANGFPQLARARGFHCAERPIPEPAAPPNQPPAARMFILRRKKSPMRQNPKNQARSTIARKSKEGP